MHHRSRLREVSIISWALLVLFLAHIFCALSVYSVSSAGALDLVWPLWYHSTVKLCTPPSITQGIALPALRTLCSKVYLISLVSSFYKTYVLIHFAKLHVWTLFKRVSVPTVSQFLSVSSLEWYMQQHSSSPYAAQLCHLACQLAFERMPPGLLVSTATISAIFAGIGSKGHTIWGRSLQAIMRKIWVSHFHMDMDLHPNPVW